MGGLVKVRYQIAGDMAINVEFGSEIREDIFISVKALYQTIKARPIIGVIECVPTYRSLLIYYDLCLISYRQLLHKLKKYVQKLTVMKDLEKRIYHIPVCYGGEYGIDLEDVCEHVKLASDEVIRMHSSKKYLIYMLGFLPGFAYLGGLEESLITPRLQNPRTLIPAGSVGIGGNQTGIYPLASPGGWRLIGKTPVKLYDLSREHPILYEAGDYIQFYPITPEEYIDIEQQVERGTYRYLMAKEV